MIAFELYLNGKKPCTAGVGNDGVLSAHVTWVRSTGERTRRNVAEDLRRQKRYVREMAKKLGWKISTRR
jgi:hypothetical protein